MMKTGTEPIKEVRREQRDEQDRSWVDAVVAQAQGRKFYGKLTVILAEGYVRRIVKEESLKPPSETR